MQIRSSVSISAVITYYNGKDSISRAVQSVIDQTYPANEIIIVDDASLEPLLAEDLQEDERIKIVRLNDNVGGGAARNIGIKAATSEYIALLDCDDEWLSDKLKRQVEAVDICGRSAATLFMCGVSTRENGKTISQSKLRKSIVSPLEAVLVDGAFLQTSTYFLRRDDAIKVGFDPTLRKHQDWDFIHRWYLAGNRFYYVDATLSVYNRGGSAQISRSRKAAHSVIWLESVRNDISKKAVAMFYLSEVYPIEFKDHPVTAMQSLLKHVRSGNITWFEAAKMTKYALRISIQSRFMSS